MSESPETVPRFPLAWPIGVEANAATPAETRDVLSVRFAAGERVTIEALTDRYRERARTSHPDVGGSDVEMAHVNRAREFALAELSV